MLGKIVLLVLALSLVACGKSDSAHTSANGKEVTTDLASALNKKLTMTPVVTLLFHRADGSNLDGAEVTLYKIKIDNRKEIAASDTTDSDGKVSLAVSAGDYLLFVNGMDEDNNSPVRDLVDYRDELQVTETNTQFYEYFAERHTFAIDTPAGFGGGLLIAQFDKKGVIIQSI